MNARLAIGFGVYEERNLKNRATGRFYLRASINRRRTWKLLNASNRRDAVAEAKQLNFRPASDTFAAIADLFTLHHCPTTRHKWQPGNARFVAEQTAHVVKLKEFFGQQQLRDIHIGALDKYKAWRCHGRLVPPTSQVDKEIGCLSNIKSYAVYIKTPGIHFNDLQSGKPRYHVTRSRARDRAPIDADMIHAIAEACFDSPRSEVFGWMTYFAMFTGCRISELLRLRLDAKEGEAGYIVRHAVEAVPEYQPIYQSVGYIHLGRRSKQRDERGRGINPKAKLWPEFSEMLECFLLWHGARYPEAAPFFPGMTGVNPVDLGSWNHALMRLRSRLAGNPHITPHGFRSYFVTKLLRDGFRFEHVSEFIGDKTIELLKSTYGDALDGPRLNWLPKERLPGWLRWRPPASKIVRLSVV